MSVIQFGGNFVVSPSISAPLVADVVKTKANLVMIIVGATTGRAILSILVSLYELLILNN